MDANISTAKVALKQEIVRLTGVLGNLTASLAHLESLELKAPTVVATIAPAIECAHAPAPAVAAAEPVAVKPASRLYSLAAPAPASAEEAQQLHLDVDAWMPTLTRVPLEDLYLAATLDRPRHLPQLPSTLDMKNTEVLRVMGNYLRHTEVVGYRDFCARLKVFTGLSHLYKRVRDKATAAINTTYPELAGGVFAFPANNEKPAPSGATQFAALAILRPVPAPAISAAA